MLINNEFFGCGDKNVSDVFPTVAIPLTEN